LQYLASSYRITEAPQASQISRLREKSFSSLFNFLRFSHSAVASSPDKPQQTAALLDYLGNVSA
jgi:hypothetical protein